MNYRVATEEDYKKGKRGTRASRLDPVWNDIINQAVDGEIIFLPSDEFDSGDTAKSVKGRLLRLAKSRDVDIYVASGSQDGQEGLYVKVRGSGDPAKREVSAKQLKAMQAGKSKTQPKKSK